MSIQKNGFRVKDPLTRNNIYFSYSGYHTNYDFDHQVHNYSRLKNLFEQYNIFFTNIHVAKWKPQGRHENGNRVSFVVDTNVNMIWYKYEGNSNGSGQNMLIYNRRKCNISSIINHPRLYHDQLLELVRDIGNINENNNNENINENNNE